MRLLTARRSPLNAMHQSPQNGAASRSLKAVCKNAVYRLLRPAFKDAAASLERLERKIDSLVATEEAAVVWRGPLTGCAVSPSGKPHDSLTRKYRDELTFWDWLVRGGGAEEKFGHPFAPLFGSWQRGRAEELRGVLGMSPEEFNAWCAQRTAVEIGPGPYPAVAVAPWRTAIAVDPISEGYIAQGLVPDECRHVLFITATGEHIPLPAGAADMVVMENCLDHCSDPGAVLREARRILKPGGHLWLLVDLMTYRDEMHPNPFTEESLRALLAREGFSAIHERTSTERRSHPHAYGEYRGLLVANGASGPTVHVTAAAAPALAAV